MRQALLLSGLVALAASGAVNAIPADPDSVIAARSDDVKVRDGTSPLVTRGDDDDDDDNEQSEDAIKKILGFSPKRKEPKGDQKHFQKDKIATTFGSDASKPTDEDHDEDTGFDQVKRGLAAELETRAPKWPFPLTPPLRGKLV